MIIIPFIQVKEEVDDTTDNYPPWVTKPPPHQPGDIPEIEGNGLDGTPGTTDPDVTPSKPASGAQASSGLTSSLKGRAIIYYLLPTFIVWLGSLITYRTPSVASASGISNNIS